MTACAFVDAFNLYYGCLKGTPNRWLDISQLCAQELPGLNFQHFHIFAARVRNRPGDPGVATRQQFYFRALETIPNLTIHYGRYTEHNVSMMLANPPTTGSRFATVVKSEEKGSDVNLASHLLLGAFRNDYDVAVVISNDTDLKEPVRIVTEEFRKHVIVLAPIAVSHRYVSRELRDVATWAGKINVNLLPVCQFPPVLNDSTGQFHKPTTW